ncbi:MAG: 4-hydroxy-tetrahydrodipicolinate reductase [Spirochaetales bacterium]|nr:4-hydroxy-tetrahydrodipicolinate reductase [Spirochaetales bacterium]
MRVIISGYGRMGRIIENMVLTRGHTVTATVDPAAPEATVKTLSKELLANADVVIDFSIPETALSNAEIICRAGKKLVMGTTGWYSDMDRMKELSGEKGAAIIWSGNFSLGVNIFFSILKRTSEIFNSFTEYDPFIHEFHHNKKTDSPSGTAVMLGNIVLDGIDRKTTIVSEELKRQINPEELHISSTRGGSIPGTHIVSFDSQVDTIELKHTARGREGFAAGSVSAAEWIENKTGFFSIDDMMKDIIKREDKRR